MATQTDKYKTAHSLDPRAEGKQNPSFVSWQRKLYFEEKVHVVLKTHITWPSLESAEMNSAYRKTQTAHGRKRKGVGGAMEILQKFILSQGISFKTSLSPNYPRNAQM